ncbi:hypothetical protein B0J11DRAFT_291188 [Dendryphion nanum]|uniref:Uncharacterized protein n=1 Tax=Dendryphion nanum TaxID=256645 RepID=A0A9P9ILP7_9PLEO|nr:hypothetical protein B0J11DRAFT_291188 [Dendryphion nanum]
MPTSTPSSVSRYRPAILALTGVAAAYAAYLIYSTVTTFNDSPADKGLHRSNAVRRPNVRSRRPRSPRGQRSQPILRERPIAPVQPLGEVEFFGVPVELEPGTSISPETLREIASQAEPGATPEQVDYRIAQLHDIFLDRFLRLTFPNAPLSTSDARGVASFLAPGIQNDEAIAQALQRHTDHFGGANADHVAQPDDDGGSVAGTEVSLMAGHFSDEDFVEPHGQVLQRTLYHIAEDRARTEGVVHRGITCNACDTKPIRGIRWHCANCHDYDLCSDCKATNSHIKTHIFYEIRVPVPNMGLQKQEPLYPGRPHVMPFTIPQSLKRRLVSETNMESEEIEALYETFTCLAATEWDSDPNQIGYAMDRRAFNQAFIPRYSTFMTAPNLIYDRIFAYYDSNLDGNIGFEEFVKGLNGMHSRDFNAKLKIIFSGYDIDGDGYISRKDVLRIFRAFYAIEQEATRNYLNETAEEMSMRGAVDVIHSGQPLGSAFTQSGIPDPLDQQRHEKASDETSNAGPVLRDDTDDTMGRDDLMRLTSSIKNFDSKGQVNEQAIKDRWRRRQFYIDEEEGFRKPQGLEESSAPGNEEDNEEEEEEEETSATPGLERPRGSRSSSRVRFQDDVDFETRSNASTSSRPFGERWGGYEIPEPEQDLGKEVLYQITQQGFNELLNTLFQEKEDNSMDAQATRAKRRQLASAIEEETNTVKNESDINRLVAFLGIFKFSKILTYSLMAPNELVSAFLGDLKQSDMTWAMTEGRVKSLFAETEIKMLEQLQSPPEDWHPSNMQAWNAKICRLQLRQELINFVREAAVALGWLSWPSQLDLVLADNSPLNPNLVEYKGPMVPQFRPNSNLELETMRSSSEISQAMDGNVSNIESGSETIGGSFWTRKVPGDYYPTQGGPYFIVNYPLDMLPESHKQTQRDEAQQDPSDDWLSPPAPSVPRPDHNHNIDHSLEHHAQHCDNDPILFFMFINPDNLCFSIDFRPTSHNTIMDRDNESRAVERKIRRDIIDKVIDDTYAGDQTIPFLASLDDVDKEIKERQGAGLINLKEFEEKMREGNLRFLESWMDWVSF